MIKALGKVPGRDKCYFTRLGVTVITRHPRSESAFCTRCFTRLIHFPHCVIKDSGFLLPLTPHSQSPPLFHSLYLLPQCMLRWKVAIAHWLQVTCYVGI